MEIREMVAGDIEELAELYRQFWGEESSLKKMHEKFQELKDNPNYIFLSALEDNQLVGSILGIVCEELYGQCQPFMVIEDFIVDKDYRQQGIGTALINKMEEYAKERGCSNIVLVTETERTGAIKFYESVGFTADTHQGFKKSL